MTSKAEYGYITRNARKIKAISYLGGKCEKCGNNDFFCLEFHHKIAEDKEKAISVLINRNRWEIIRNELDKCILVCKNCHQEIHTGSNSIVSILKEKLMEYKKVTGCEKCGYSGRNLGSLDFHHIDPCKKKFKIMKEVNKRKKIIDYIREEVDKCIVLCSNCHNKEHSDVDRFKNYLDRFMIYLGRDRNLKKINKEEVIKLHRQGMKNIEIAKNIKCAKSSITYILKNI